MQGEPLTDRELEILAFEKQIYVHPGVKEDTIRTLFDISPTRYYQQLNVIIDKPAALVHDPVLVKRLLRLREQRSARRAMPRASASGR